MLAIETCLMEDEEEEEEQPILRSGGGRTWPCRHCPANATTVYNARRLHAHITSEHPEKVRRPRVALSPTELVTLHDGKVDDAPEVKKVIFGCKQCSMLFATVERRQKHVCRGGIFKSVVSSPHKKPAILKVARAFKCNPPRLHGAAAKAERQSNDHTPTSNVRSIVCRQCQRAFDDVDAYDGHDCSSTQEDVPMSDDGVLDQLSRECGLGAEEDASTSSSRLLINSRPIKRRAIYVGRSAWSKPPPNTATTAERAVGTRMTEVTTCPHCDVALTHSRQTTAHKRKHVGAEPFECHVCLRTFKHCHMMRYHREIAHPHANVDGNQCDVCARNFESANDRDYHRAMHDEENAYTYSCPFCPNVKDIKLITVENHIRKTHPSQYRRSAMLCQQEESDGYPPSAATFTKHREDAENQSANYIRRLAPNVRRVIAAKVQIAMPMNDQRLKCDRCLSTYSTVARLESHRRLIHPKAPPRPSMAATMALPTTATMDINCRCDVCEKLFSRRHVMLEHRRRMHRGVASPPQTTHLTAVKSTIIVHKVHKVLPRPFSSIMSSLMTAATATALNPIDAPTCSECGQMFASPLLLQRHIGENHRSNTAYKLGIAVSQADKPSTSRSTSSVVPSSIKTSILSSSIKTSISVMPAAEMVKQRFAKVQRANELRKMARHGAEPDCPWRCDLCHQSFRTRRLLRAHSTREHK